MFTSADLIEALRRRRRPVGSADAAPAFPPGWADWLAAMRVRAGAVTGAAAGAIVALLAGRPPRPRRRVAPPRNALAAWASLAYPLWEPDPRDERGLRIVSVATTLLVQLTWLALLLLLMQARFLAATEAAARGEEHVVEAVFVGDGTPEDAGGGAGEVQAPSTPVAAAAPASPADPAPAPTTTPAPAVPPPPTQDPAPAQSVADADAAPAQDVLQVTETPMPDIAFTLPPPRPAASVPEVAVRERPVPDASLQAVEIPAVRAPQRVDLAPPEPDTPVVQVEVRERAVAQATETVRLPTAPRREVTVETPAPAARPAPEVAARDRAVPLRDPAPAPASETAAPTPAPAVAQAPARPAPGGATTPAPGAGDRTPAPTAGHGSAAAAPPGAAPSTRAADDWGDAAIARDGGRPGRPSGLFGADGRPRLADGGRVGGGLPPGTITEDFEKIDRMGTWLRRPAPGYESTRFDRYWVPSESLLEEWVRRSVQTVLIPIPGTSKTIQCNVALLAFGGGCEITDPNMQDVETDGRPPPDVPWKPELQEDRDSLGG
ncbi:hypothetical protein [Luteimonas sp. FCS-9]|uniref:hypothetical protein n=1 Tax=Luteimonas sp. FCS-9 TaxID=1547516 RepID=UPI00063EBE54|nr:hypothetical protein [Luteimonas sp. FCS-9]KLJ01621.1 hypothetical protein WQ56_04890 [Luteimonas sp. FCS-9]